MDTMASRVFRFRANPDGVLIGRLKRPIPFVSPRGQGRDVSYPAVLQFPDGAIATGAPGKEYTSDIGKRHHDLALVVLVAPNALDRMLEEFPLRRPLP